MAVKRIKNVSIARPIMYGNISVPLDAASRKRGTPADHTHKWTVFVRDPAGKDNLGYIIKKVSFKLHDTYANSLRTIEQPPFEVTETGWGEFDVAIRIYFTPVSTEKNLVVHHHLKLHPFGHVPGEPLKPQKVESMLYDELVFNEPTEAMFEILMSKPGAVLNPKPALPERPFSYQTESEELDRLTKGLEKVYQQVKKTKERIQELEQDKVKAEKA